MSPRTQAVLDFWFVDTPSEKRFKKDPTFDQLIKDKFLKTQSSEDDNHHIQKRIFGNGRENFG